MAFALVAAIAQAADTPPAEQKPLSVALVEALNKIAGGPHPGFRANHAKGVMATGHVTPARSAATISKAPHFAAPVPITARYSNDSGLHPPAVSYATLTYFGLNAFKFTNAKGNSQYIRYQIRPLAGEQYITEEAGAKAPPNYLMDELPVRLAKGPIKYTLVAQLAKEGDNITDPAKAWPATNPVVVLGTISVEKFLDDPEASRAILFNPVSLPAGIEPSADPILAWRFPAYAVSFGQRAATSASAQAPAARQKGRPPVKNLRRKRTA